MNITVFVDNQRELALESILFTNIQTRMKIYGKNCNTNIIWN
jgi:hypothetical protein